MRADYDFVVWATYGLGPSRGLFKSVKYQVAEKILIRLPQQLQGVSLVVVDGPLRPLILMAARSARYGVRQEHQPLDHDRCERADSGAISRAAECAAL